MKRRSLRSAEVTKSKPVKPPIKKLGSFECVSKENISDVKNKVPSLIIRRKKLRNCDINNEQIIESEKKSESILIDSDDTINYNLHYSTQKLNLDEIENYIQTCSKLSRDLDCKFLYQLIKEKVSGNNYWNSLLLPKNLQEFSPYRKVNLKKLYDWLIEWKNIHSGEKKIDLIDTDDDFEPDFADSSFKKVHKSSYPFCVICGPSGTGKSALVYALAKELDYKVFEVNSSSRRTGKDVMDNLDCAASNKHVGFNKLIKAPSSSDILKDLNDRKRKSVNDFFKPRTKRAKTCSQLTRNDSPLLIESHSLFLFDDSDVVLEEDHGFWMAISKFIDKSTRPVIITCSDKREMEKFFTKYGYSNYLLIDLVNSVRNLAVYLQLILLTRNIKFDLIKMSNWMKNQTSRLYDVRHLINNLQFQSVTNDLIFWPSVNYTDWNNNNNNSGGQRSKKVVSKRKELNIHQIFNYMDVLSQTDTMFSDRTSEPDLERAVNHDWLYEVEYEHGDVIRQDMKTTLLSTYNSTINKYSDCSDVFNIPKFPLLYSKKSCLQSNSVKSVVADSVDTTDRIDALLKIATFEEERKENNTNRRFYHYFKKVGFHISPSDYNQILSGYK